MKTGAMSSVNFLGQLIRVAALILHKKLLKNVIKVNN